MGSLPRSLSLLRAKTGRFLANGMSFHYEATPEAYEHGLLEVASPECRDPLTLLHYECAKDELVEELSGQVNADLRRAGFRGEVRVGKNNVDSRGHTFGSHENYWVEDVLSWPRRLLLLALWLPLGVLTLPVRAGILRRTRSYAHPAWIDQCLKEIFNDRAIGLSKRSQNRRRRGRPARRQCPRPPRR